MKDDLDWIVMKCLEKETSRRYQVVNELAADIDRHLRFEPVRARPPTLSYTACKLARRHRVACSFAVAAVVFVLSATAFAVITMMQAERVAMERDYAEREKQRAEKTSNVVLNVFAMADPFQSPGTVVSGSALLDEAARSVERELRDQPQSRARLLQAIGRAYKRRGEFKASIDSLTAAVQIFREMRGAESEALRTMVYLSVALRESGDLREAQHLLLDAEHLAKRSGLQQTLEYADMLLDRGRTYQREGRIAEATKDIEMSLHLFRDLVGTRSFQVAEALGELTVIHLWTEDFRQAEQTAREALRIFEITVPPMYPDRVSAEINLAQSLYSQHRLDEAAPLVVDALQKQTERFGRNSVAVINTLDELAIIRYAQRRFVEAEKLSREAVVGSRVTNGERHPSTAYVATTLARTLLARGKYPEAEAILREVLETFGARLSPDHQYIASAEYFLGEVLLATRRPREAEAVLAASLDRWKRAKAPPWRAMRSANALGEALYRQGRASEGEKYLSESLRALSTDAKAESAAIHKARQRAKRYLRGSDSATAEGKQRTI